METLRRARRLTCQLLLVWFALSLGIATAAPVLHPHEGEVVCSGSGGMMVMPSEDLGTGGQGQGDHDCHQCVMVAAPPVAIAFAAHEAPAVAPDASQPSLAPSPAPAPFQQRGPPLP